MILPEPREDSLHQKAIAFVSTLVCSVLVFIFLYISDIEIKQASREVFRQIDMASFAPRNIRLGHQEKYTEAENANNVQLIAGSVNAADGDDVEDEAVDSAEGKSATLQEEAALENKAASHSAPASTRSVTSSPPTQAPKEIVAPPKPKQAPIAPASSPKPSTSPEKYSTANTANATSLASSEGGISKLSLDSFGRDYKDLDVREIIDWMKNNPSELPKGIRQLVRFRPAFLSSVTSFNMEGKDYELYLMCKESLFEVHVVLVEQNEATYLVDRSFQKLSTYLRKGQVRRTPDDQIIAVRSNMASNDSSDEFYSLFLSWWEWTKSNGSS